MTKKQLKLIDEIINDLKIALPTSQDIRYIQISKAITKLDNLKKEIQ